jgi:hypothetical protein
MTSVKDSTENSLDALLETSEVLDIFAQKIYEDTPNYEKRLRFLDKLLKAFIEQANGNTEVFRSYIPRLAVYSACFTNVNLYGCTYSPAIHQVIEKFSDESSSF